MILTKSTQNSALKVLLIEDDRDYAEILRSRISQSADPRFEVVTAHSLRTGLDQLAQGGVDVVLTDLSLPDSRELQTLDQILEEAPGLPVVVLTALDSKQLGLEAVRKGAQDYLIKGGVGATELPRILRYAIERHRLQREIQSLSLRDALTGLHNRRGFITLAEQQLKLARRTNRELLVIFVDLDGLKKINDAYGHEQGDRALADAAALLKSAFRESDIVARMGGDEFAVLAIDACQENIQTILERLSQALNRYYAKASVPFRLLWSEGVAHFNPSHPYPLDELIRKADHAMYQKKRKKRQWLTEWLTGKLPRIEFNFSGIPRRG